MSFCEVEKRGFWSRIAFGGESKGCDNIFQGHHFWYDFGKVAYRCLTTAICDCIVGISSFRSAFYFSRVSMFEELLFVAVCSNIVCLSGAFFDALFFS